jgi:hypothetical protein
MWLTVNYALCNLIPELDHFRATLRAPGAENGMNEITAQAPHVQPAGERIRRLLIALLVGLILDNHDDVQGKIPSRQKSQSRPSEQSVGGIVRLVRL